MSDALLKTLGGFSIDLNGRSIPVPPTKKARGLLCYLAMHPDAEIARDALLEAFWPDADPERARESLRTALHSIRRIFRDAELDPSHFLFTNRSVVKLTSAIDCDARHFAELARTQDGEDQEKALSLYRGDFLEGDYDNWASFERERLSHIYETLLDRLLNESPSAATAQRLLERNPYHEHAYAVLIDSDLAAGRFESAAKLLERFRAALAEIGRVVPPALAEKWVALRFSPELAPTDVDALLRRGSDLAGAGEAVAAAEVFDRAVAEAIRLNQSGKALAHLESAIATLESTAPVQSREPVLASLKKLAAELLRITGDFPAAIALCTEALARAQSFGRPKFVAEVLLLRARLYGDASSFERQRYDALSILELEQSRDDKTIVRARLELVSAYANLGSVSDAVAQAVLAESLAQRTGDPEATANAALELAQAHASLWHFSASAESLKRAAGTRPAGPGGRARMLLAYAQLHSFTGRVEDAEAAARDAVHVLEPAQLGGPTSRTWSSVTYLRCVLAAERGAWNDVLASADLLAAAPACLNSPLARSAVLLLRIDALLGRSLPRDAAMASELQSELDRLPGFAPAPYGRGDCPALSRARLAVSAQSGNAHRLLLDALDTLEERARQVPLDADRLFAKLASTAKIAGAFSIADRSEARRAHYYARRVGAADAAASFFSSNS